MSFERLHKAIIFALVCVGIAPLVLSGELPFLVVLGLVPTVGYSMFRKIPRQRDDARTRFWNTVTVGGLFVCIGLGAATGNWLLYAILFALLMIVTRLYQSRGSRDVFQLIGLSFVALVAGAVVNPDFSFVLFFISYVVLLIWSLVLLHLQRDIESLEDGTGEATAEEVEDTWRTRSLINGRFLAGTSGLAMIVLLGSTLFFFLFPRLGMGFFFGQARSGKKVSGFSDEMELGHFGTIKNDMDVVVRVAFPQNRRNGTRQVRLRGISFDRYDGRRWSKSETQKGTYALPMLPGGKWAVVHSTARELGFPKNAKKLIQDIYLEPLNMDNRMIFGAPRMITIAIDNVMLDRLKRDRTRFYQDRGQDVQTRGRKDTALRYTVTSALMKPGPEVLRKATGPIPRRVSDFYLQLPPSMDVNKDCKPEITPRPKSCAVPDIAAQVTEGKDNNFDRVRAIATYVRGKHKYSTEGGHDLDSPVGDFLTEKKWGHCEYFASAMVLMLRSLKIPARPANGFFGGAYNRYGNYYAVRQADAHSWVEVYYPGSGWITYDPTPPSMVLVPPEEGLWADVTAFFDSLKLKWYSWVVEYDLEKQLEVFKGLGKMLSGIFPSPDGKATDPRAWDRGVKEWAKNPNTWMYFGIPIFLIIFFRSGFLGALIAFLKEKLRPKRPPSRSRISEIYSQMLLLLAKQGITKRGAETPREFAGRVQDERQRETPGVVTITEIAEAVIYAEEPLLEADAQRAEQALETLKRAS